MSTNEKTENLNYPLFQYSHMSSNNNNIRTDDMVSGSEHQRYVFVGLLNDLLDLHSKTFRKHWWYRANAWRINTNAAMNSERQKDWEYLMVRVGEYERRNDYEKLI